MEAVGINIGYLLGQLLVMGIYIAIMAATLLSLYRRKMDTAIKVTWAVVIFSIPILGIMAFWIIASGLHPTR